MCRRCPANSQIIGSICECENGYVMEEGEFYCRKCPPNSGVVDNVCTCFKGYELVDEGTHCAEGADIITAPTCTQRQKLDRITNTCADCGTNFI